MWHTSALFLLWHVGAVQGETPVDKVITLLGKLRDQVQEEGKGEAASYDRFACFCKDHADSKLMQSGSRTPV